MSDLIERMVLKTLDKIPLGGYGKKVCSPRWRDQVLKWMWCEKCGCEHERWIDKKEWLKDKV